MKNSENAKENEVLLSLKDVLKITTLSKSTWWAGIQAGVYPKGMKIGKRRTVWLSSAIQAFIRRLIEENK